MFSLRVFIPENLVIVCLGMCTQLYVIDDVERVLSFSILAYYVKRSYWD